MSAGFSRLAETSLRQAMERFSDCFYDTRGNRLGIAFEQREKINRILMSSASGQDPSYYAPRPSRFSLRHATNNMRRQWQNLSPETMYLIWHTLNAAQKRQLVPNPRILTALDKKWSPVQDLSPKPGKRPTRHFGALHRQAPDKKIVLHAEGYTAELIAGTAMEAAPGPSTIRGRKREKNLPALASCLHLAARFNHTFVPTQGEITSQLFTAYASRTGYGGTPSFVTGFAEATASTRTPMGANMKLIMGTRQALAEAIAENMGVPLTNAVVRYSPI